MDDAAMAQKAEEEVLNYLVKAFKPRVALMWSGLKVEKVLQVARESVQYDANQQRRLQPHLVEVELTPSETDFYKVLSLNVDKIQQDVTILTDHLFFTATTLDLL